jgi:RNA polymerase sigma-70 factor (ECF subfamily)
MTPFEEGLLGHNRFSVRLLPSFYLVSFIFATEPQADIPGFVALLREDAWFTMPPLPAWVQGRAAIATVLATRIFTPGRQWRLLPTRANGSPAFGLYRREAEAGVYQFFGLVVLGVEGKQIASLVAFLEVSSLSSFGLPPTTERHARGQVS